MKINQLKINQYGKLKEKQIEFSPTFNIVYGKNEAGKSTLLSFIVNCLYGISKNKKGKEISDFERYLPWSGDDFSGKLEYELDNKEKYEIFREFKKRNPKIYNGNKEDISKQFNIDKNKGSEFFYEQTKIDEALFLSTVVVNQQEVKLEKQEQNILVQKIANLVGTGEDNVSFKRAIERINRRKLEEIGTDKSREKPINIIGREIQKLTEEKQELKKYENVKYEIEEKKSLLRDEIEKLENENNFLKEIKLVNENEKIENEKIKMKINMKNENDKKIENLKSEKEELNKNNIFEKNKKIKLEKNKLNKKIIIIFFIILLINILQFLIIKNKIFNYIFLLTVPTVLIFYLFSKNKIKNKNNKIKKELEKINEQKNNLNNEINLLEKNNSELEKEIKQLNQNFILKINLEKEKIKNKFSNRIQETKINNFLKLENPNFEIQNIENKLNNKKIELHTLDIEYKNIEPKLENLVNLEEKLVNYNEEMLTLKNLDNSINLAKEILTNAYEKMKNTVTPKFTKELSETISQITNGKYNNIQFHDQEGIVVELENGNYMPASRLSVGMIDQLYLSLRLSMAGELSEEKMPIILDEAFAYFDKERLKNILTYLFDKFKNHQIIIFTCTNREKEILDEINGNYKMIKM